MLRTALLFATLPLCVYAAPVSGEAVYRARCASCHDSPGPGVPGRDALGKLPAAHIQRSLDAGVMMTLAAALPAAERTAVATYLGKPGTDLNLGPAAYCANRKVSLSGAPRAAWNGWSPTLANTRYQPAETAGLTLDQLRNLKLKWAFGFEGDLTSFSQPAVLDEQVFVGSSAGLVYALRAGSGCIEWLFQAAAPIRTAILVAPVEGAKTHAVLFGDQGAWVYAVEAETGKLLWYKKVDDHPAARITGSPVVFEGSVYVPVSSLEESFAGQPRYECCTFRGSVSALRVRDGGVIWKSWTIPEPATRSVDPKTGTGRWGPSGAGSWSAPTIDAKRRTLYVTTGNNYSEPPTAASDGILAMELASGRILWTRQFTPRDVFGCQGCTDDKGPDFDFGSSSMLVTTAAGRELVVAGQKSGIVYALDPDRKGDIVWQTRVAQGTTHGGVQWGMAADGQYVYVPIADGELKRIPDSTGQLKRLMDPDDGGGLAALRIADGSVAWKAAPPRVCAGVPNCSPSQLAAATAIPGAIFSGALDGHIRAYAAEDGKLIWDFNTLRKFATVNGVPANGGALNGNGPVVVKGMVFVNSGYDHFGSITGNVLLAFAP